MTLSLRDMLLSVVIVNADYQHRLGDKHQGKSLRDFRLTEVKSPTLTVGWVKTE